MSAQVDLARIAALGEVIGDDLATIVASIVQSIERAIDALASTLGEGDLTMATQAAHTCRNDALMVGAAPLLRALTDVESACRDGRLEAARPAFARVRAIWPGTRTELERAAQPA